MLAKLKLMKLRSALRDKRNLEAAFTAVRELGRMQGPKAVDLLIEALGRLDNVARSAARELGRMGDARAAQPLADILSQPKVSQAAMEGLITLGEDAIDVLINRLGDESEEVRLASSRALGEIGNRRAVEPLVDILGNDNSYQVRIAAANALGLLKDEKAVWVLVGTLKLRDESSPERQQALFELQQTAEAAMRKIGSPLIEANAEPGKRLSAEELVAKMEGEIEETNVHPRLLSDPKHLSEKELTGILKELVSASEEISWAKLENREPLLATYFSTYDQRRDTAEKVGRELYRRGGRALLDEVLDRDLSQYKSIKNWWDELE